MQSVHGYPLVSNKTKSNHMKLKKIVLFLFVLSKIGKRSNVIESNKNLSLPKLPL